MLLEVKSVTLQKPTNAGVYLVKDAADLEDDGRDDRLRVRVSNEPDSKSEQFTLAWAGELGPLKSVEPLKVYVPPGRSRVVRVGEHSGALAQPRISAYKPVINKP